MKNHEIMKTGLNQNRGMVFKFEIHQNHKIVKMGLNREIGLKENRQNAKIKIVKSRIKWKIVKIRKC